MGFLVGRKNSPVFPNWILITTASAKSPRYIYEARLPAWFNVSKIKIKCRILSKHMTEIWKTSNDRYDRLVD